MAAAQLNCGTTLLSEQSRHIEQFLDSSKYSLCKFDIRPAANGIVGRKRFIYKARICTSHLQDNLGEVVDRVFLRIPNINRAAGPVRVE
jgi:hypothetical protein